LTSQNGFINLPNDVDTNFANIEFEGNVSISEMGNLSYSIPIGIPKGINGIEPSIAINYTSSSSSNILGVGWNLNCLSMISRGGKTFFNNYGIADGINNNQEDFLYFDGTLLRLLPVKGIKALGYATYGVSSAISVGLAGNYYANGGTDASVGIKASIDVIMGGVGFLGPVGFGVSATYFLLDAGGAFGGYGDPLLTPNKIR
jgi:hypothetical protein